ncbi:MAG: hypothetical protein ACRCZE_02905 [Candidatus Altimarinota bacterium]
MTPQNNTETGPVGGISKFSTIDSLRSQDQKSLEGEVLPDKQTLNSRKVQVFLRENAINIKTIDEGFDFDVLARLTQGAATPMEAKINNSARLAKNILQKYGENDLVKETDMAVVEARLNTLSKPLDGVNKPAISAQESRDVLQAMNYVQIVREYAKNLLYMEERMVEERKHLADGGSKGVEQSVTDTIKDKLGDIGKNWDKWSGKEKLLFGGAALIGGIMLFQSENETLVKVKGYLKTAGLVVGGAWLGNKAYQLFTGESLIDDIFQRGKASSRQSIFYKEAFGADEKGAELLSKAFVMAGDQNFLDIANKYSQAKLGSSNKVEGLKMPPEEAYQALDIFFSKYGLDKMKREYRHAKPPLTFNQVVVAEMAEDPSVKLKDGIAERVYNSTKNTFNEGYEYLAATRPGSWTREMYHKYIKGEPTEAQMSEFTKKFGHSIDEEKDLETTIQTKIAPGNFDTAKNFQETVKKGRKDIKSGVSYLEGSDGYVYVVVEKSLGIAKENSSQELEQALQSSVGQSEVFLSSHLKQSVASVQEKTEVAGSVFVNKTNKFRYFVRVKK